uniref:CBM20 domain-containing protein n=1 Tax=Chromera velia CCMP2878 TaxID=1169474 RepID=A0A0G4GU92_9ALVE|eukprot:Cvel_23398.t1-p1 / transcript=Cvel_23398.t1 / gene=Cvel_23398 / organism=Chromera_velia_CCMP2878 / gene_product=hypothetical protein / transcript_product=hypothetical protein / location=Cvel_scaffold2406:5513-16724(+) / protein_length=1787 / sequence_SO=supercontig / SO=protein_coding / is_pseudo=false
MILSFCSGPPPPSVEHIRLTLRCVCFEADRDGSEEVRAVGNVPQMGQWCVARGLRFKRETVEGGNGNGNPNLWISSELFVKPETLVEFRLVLVGRESEKENGRPGPNVPIVYWEPTNRSRHFPVPETGSCESAYFLLGCSWGELNLAGAWLGPSSCLAEMKARLEWWWKGRKILEAREKLRGGVGGEETEETGANSESPLVSSKWDLLEKQLDKYKQTAKEQILQMVKSREERAREREEKREKERERIREAVKKARQEAAQKEEEEKKGMKSSSSSSSCQKSLKTLDRDREKNSEIAKEEVSSIKKMNTQTCQEEDQLKKKINDGVPLTEIFDEINRRRKEVVKEWMRMEREKKEDTEARIEEVKEETCGDREKTCPPSSSKEQTDTQGGDGSVEGRKKEGCVEDNVEDECLVPMRDDLIPLHFSVLKELPSTCSTNCPPSSSSPSSFSNVPGSSEEKTEVESLKSSLQYLNNMNRGMQTEFLRLQSLAALGKLKESGSLQAAAAAAAGGTSASSFASSSSSSSSCDKRENETSSASSSSSSSSCDKRENETSSASASSSASVTKEKEKGGEKTEEEEQEEALSDSPKSSAGFLSRVVGKFGLSFGGWRKEETKKKEEEIKEGQKEKEKEKSLPDEKETCPPASLEEKKKETVEEETAANPLPPQKTPTDDDAPPLPDSTEQLLKALEEKRKEGIERAYEFGRMIGRNALSPNDPAVRSIFEAAGLTLPVSLSAEQPEPDSCAKKSGQSRAPPEKQKPKPRMPPDIPLNAVDMPPELAALLGNAVSHQPPADGKKEGRGRGEKEEKEEGKKEGRGRGEKEEKEEERGEGDRREALHSIGSRLAKSDDPGIMSEEEEVAPPPVPVGGTLVHVFSPRPRGANGQRAVEETTEEKAADCSEKREGERKGWIDSDEWHDVYGGEEEPEDDDSDGTLELEQTSDEEEENLQEDTGIGGQQTGAASSSSSSRGLSALLSFQKADGKREKEKSTDRERGKETPPQSFPHVSLPLLGTREQKDKKEVGKETGTDTETESASPSLSSPKRKDGDGGDKEGFTHPQKKNTVPTRFYFFPNQPIDSPPLNASPPRFPCGHNKNDNPYQKDYPDLPVARQPALQKSWEGGWIKAHPSQSQPRGNGRLPQAPPSSSQVQVPDSSLLPPSPLDGRGEDFEKSRKAWEGMWEFKDCQSRQARRRLEKQRAKQREKEEKNQKGAGRPKAAGGQSHAHSSSSSSVRTAAAPQCNAMTPSGQQGGSNTQSACSSSGCHHQRCECRHRKCGAVMKGRYEIAEVNDGGMNIRYNEVVFLDRGGRVVNADETFTRGKGSKGLNFEPATRSISDHVREKSIENFLTGSPRDLDEFYVDLAEECGWKGHENTRVQLRYNNKEHGGLLVDVDLDGPYPSAVGPSPPSSSAAASDSTMKAHTETETGGGENELGAKSGGLGEGAASASSCHNTLSGRLCAEGRGEEGKKTGEGLLVLHSKDPSDSGEKTRVIEAPSTDTPPCIDPPYGSAYHLPFAIPQKHRCFVFPEDQKELRRLLPDETIDVFKSQANRTSLDQWRKEWPWSDLNCLQDLIRLFLRHVIATPGMAAPGLYCWFVDTHREGSDKWLRRGKLTLSADMRSIEINFRTPVYGYSWQEDPVPSPESLMPSYFLRRELFDLSGCYGEGVVPTQLAKGEVSWWDQKDEEGVTRYDKALGWKFAGEGFVRRLVMFVPDERERLCLLTVIRFLTVTAGGLKDISTLRDSKSVTLLDVLMPVSMGSRKTVNKSSEAGKGGGAGTSQQAQAKKKKPNKKN